MAKANEVKFTVDVPEQDDAGYIGFLDDMMSIVELNESVEGGKMSPAAWRAMMNFVESCISGDNTSREIVRSMSMPQLSDVFEQIVDAASADPKDD